MNRHRREFLELSFGAMKRRNPEHSEEELMTTLPDYFDKLVRALRAGDVPQEDRDTEEARHASRLGEQRLARGFDIASVAHMFGAFSETLGVLAERHREVFSPAEYGVFNRIIDASIARAIESFHQGAKLGSEHQTAQYLGFFAHELRNELWSARMAYTLILEGSVGVNSKTGAVVARSLQRMESLVSQSLAAVQLESGRGPELRQLSLSDVLDNLQAAAFPERQISLVVETQRRSR